METLVPDLATKDSNMKANLVFKKKNVNQKTLLLDALLCNQNNVLSM